MAAMPNGRCRMHGGPSLSGIASPTYKHGGYSEPLPKRLLEKYEQARTDPELLNLSNALALIETRISDVLSRVESGDAGETWQKLSDAWDAFVIAQRAKDAPKTQMALSTIGRIIETGAGDWAAWREVLNLIERRRKLVESEGKRRMQMQDMTDNAEIIKLIDRLSDAVHRHVHDPVALRAIQAEISPVLGAGLPRRAAGSDE
jgi:hypothetical protein